MGTYQAMPVMCDARIGHAGRWRACGKGTEARRGEREGGEKEGEGGGGGGGGGGREWEGNCRQGISVSVVLPPTPEGSVCNLEGTQMS
jgi:hypothetical protein